MWSGECLAWTVSGSAPAVTTAGSAAFLLKLQQFSLPSKFLATWLGWLFEVSGDVISSFTSLVFPFLHLFIMLHRLQGQRHLHRYIMQHDNIMMIITTIKVKMSAACDPLILSMFCMWYIESCSNDNNGISCFSIIGSRMVRRFSRLRFK